MQPLECRLDRIMGYSIDQMCTEFERFIEMERNLGDNAEEMDSLEDFAIDIRLNLEQTNFGDAVPFELWRCVGNVDFGKVMPGSRDWILEDAETAIQKIRANGLPKPQTKRRFWLFWKSRCS